MLILLSYPALLLTTKGSMGVLFFLLLIISSIVLYRERFPFPHWDGYSIAFALAMASPMVAIFLSQAYHGNFRSPPYDWAARFLLSIPIFLALRQTNTRTITIVQYGLPIGLLIGLIKLMLDPFIWADVINRSTPYQAFNLIHFSASALMLGFLSLFSINWGRKDSRLVLALKLCGFLAGMYMSLQAGERGSWIAIPPLLLLWVAAHSKGKLWLKFGAATLMILTLIWVGYSMNNIVHDRVHSAFNDLSNLGEVKTDTSIGIRMQLWQAALHLFIENPLFGVGPNGFEQAIPALKAAGMLTPYASKLGYSEIHNEVLAKCANTGLFGLLSILSIYLVPIFIFWRSTKAAKSSVRVAGFMGICLVSGFFIFGLTAEIFNLKMTAAFFSFNLAVLMAAATDKSTLPHKSL
jgi:O-antigen ligase